MRGAGTDEGAPAYGGKQCEGIEPWQTAAESHSDIRRASRRRRLQWREPAVDPAAEAPTEPTGEVPPVEEGGLGARGHSS